VQVWPDLPVLLDPLVFRVPRDPLDQQELLGRLVQLVQLGLQGHQVRAALRDQAECPERQGRRVLLALLVRREVQELLVHPDLQVALDQLAGQERAVQPELLDSLDLAEPREQPGPADNPE